MSAMIVSPARLHMRNTAKICRAAKHNNWHVTITNIRTDLSGTCDDMMAILLIGAIEGDLLRVDGFPDMSLFLKLVNDNQGEITC